MIEFHHVTKRFLTQKALDDVTMTLPSGKIIGIVGENGSGKSTTLKLMSGLIRPTKGTVKIHNRLVDRRICRMVSYLSELDAYYPFYTVGETIDFYHSQFSDFDKRKAHEILQFMKLDRNKKVKNLSKGNRGRLKIALTLARDVPVILMDEPLSGLDPMVRDSIVKGLISFIDLEKQTVIITTHEIQEIEPLLDMVVLIKDGRVRSMQDVEELKSNENIGIVDWMKKTNVKRGEDH